MGYNLKDNRGMICAPISFRDAANVNAQNIAELMKEQANNSGVPMKVRIDSVKEGGLFGSRYSCVVITHPNPPQQYFDHVIVINGNTVNFFFFGNSKANYATNRANERKNKLSGVLLNAISGSSEMAYQQEMVWHRDVHDVFQSCVN